MEIKETSPSDTGTTDIEDASQPDASGDMAAHVHPERQASKISDHQEPCDQWSASCLDDPATRAKQLTTSIESLTARSSGKSKRSKQGQPSNPRRKSIAVRSDSISRSVSDLLSTPAQSPAKRHREPVLKRVHLRSVRSQSLSPSSGQASDAPQRLFPHWEDSHDDQVVNLTDMSCFEKQDHSDAEARLQSSAPGSNAEGTHPQQHHSKRAPERPTASSAEVTIQHLLPTNIKLLIAVVDNLEDVERFMTSVSTWGVPCRCISNDGFRNKMAKPLESGKWLLTATLSQENDAGPEVTI